MAILAMPEHGRDARGTFLCRPQGRRYNPLRPRPAARFGLCHSPLLFRHRTLFLVTRHCPCRPGVKLLGNFLGNFAVDLPPAVLYDGTSENLMGESRVKFQIELDREEDGRWIAEIASLPGVLTYGRTRQEAVAKVKALALRVLADEIEKEKKDRPVEISIACYP